MTCILIHIYTHKLTVVRATDPPATEKLHITFNFPKTHFTLASTKDGLQDLPWIPKSADAQIYCIKWCRSSMHTVSQVRLLTPSHGSKTIGYLQKKIHT